MKKLACTVDPSVELYVRYATGGADDAESAFMRSTRIIASETVRIFRIELEVPDDFKGAITVVTPGVDADGRLVHYCAPLNIETKQLDRCNVQGRHCGDPACMKFHGVPSE